MLTAGTPDEAVEILEQNEVTQLIVDYDLGEDYPRGTELVIGWRKRFSSIRLVLLLTGTLLSAAQIPVEVDHFFLKGGDPKNLLKVLKS